MSQRTAPRGIRRGLAAAAALSVVSVGLFAGTSAAFAENMNLDPDTQGSITIHKFENPGGASMNPDGTGDGLDKLKPIEGVVFEVCHIDGIDLTAAENAGWDAVNAISVSDRKNAADSGVTKLGAYDLSDCSLVTTGPDGSAPAVSGLELGAYLVREVDAPAKVVKRVDPFIVTVPTPSINEAGEGDGSWVYDVNVYPKNTVGNPPVKRIEDQTGATAAVGSKIDFSVSQVLPQLGEGETYELLTLTDTLDSRLQGDAASVAVYVGAVKLDAADFTAEVKRSSDGKNDILTVKLTQAGLDKLQGKGGETIRVEFSAKILSVGDGEFLNQAHTNINDMVFVPGKPGEPGDPETPTNEVKSRWGLVEVTKVDPKQRGLEGAEFEIRMGDTADCADPTNFTDVMDPMNTTKKLVVKSGENGVVTIPGLWIGNDSIDENGDPTIGLQTRCYQLVEIKAPAGFVLPGEGKNTTNVVVEKGQTSQVKYNIVNDQQEVPELPLTGAAGQLLMVAGGLALVAIAAGSVLVSRRKQRA